MRKDSIAKTRSALIFAACLSLGLYAGASRAAAQEAVHPGTAREFHDLVSTADARYKAGLLDDALAMAKRAEQLGTQTTLPATPTTARAWNQLGMLFFNLGFTPQAKKVYERGFDIAKSILPSNDLLLANLHNNLGQAEQRLAEQELGNLTVARDHLQDALTIKKSLKQVTQAELAIVMDNLGSVELALGNFDQAENLHKQAEALFLADRGKPDGNVATTWVNLGMVNSSKRDYALAGEYLRRAFLTHQEVYGPEHRETIRDIVLLAQVYLSSGDEPKADAIVNHLVTLGDDRSSKSTLMTLAEACKELASEGYRLAQLGLAERLATRAVTLYGAATGPTAPETLEAKRLKADILAKKGSFAAAEDLYKDLLKVYGPENVRSSTRVRIELGKSLRSRGKGSYREAIQIFQSAIKDLRDESPLDEENLASAMGNLGMLYYLCDKPQLAQEQYSKALALLEHRGKSSTWLLYNQAMLWYHLGEYDKARVGYEEVKALWASAHSADHPFVGTVAANIALVYWAQGDVNQALRSFAEANRIQEWQVQRTLTVGTEWERLAYARSMQNRLYKMISFCLARAAECQGESAKLTATMMLQHKGRVLDAMAQSMAQIREHLTPADSQLLNRLNKVRGEIGELNRSVHSWDNSAKRVALEEQERQIESELSHRSALYRNRLATVTAEMVVDALDADAVLVEYVKYRVFNPVRTGKHDADTAEHYAAVVLRRQRDPQVIDLGPASEIDGKVRLFRSQLGATSSRAAVTDSAVSRGRVLRSQKSEDDDYHVEARQLYQLLIAPIREALHNTNLLLVVPDGSLNLIPFGLLSDTQNKRLTDLFVVNYLSSGRELLRKDQSHAASPTVVVVANPNFEAKVATIADAPPSRFIGRSGFPPLPGTQGEADALQKLFPSMTRLEGPEASVVALKNISRPGVLHVATHGVFSPMTNAKPDQKTETILLGSEYFVLESASPSTSENPMLYSGLVLAGANRTDQARGQSIITAQELAYVDLRDTQLVVLSACETGAGTNNYGNEFAGLRRAITIAGAASQVTSLWKVDDRATEALMTKYYELLLTGHGRAKALQLAQQQIEKDPRWSHPVFWAAFLPSGDWTPMSELLSKMRR